MFLCFCYQNDFRDLRIVSSSLFQVNYFGISGCFLASGALYVDSVSLSFSLLSRLEFSEDGSSVYFVFRWCIITAYLQSIL